MSQIRDSDVILRVLRTVAKLNIFNCESRRVVSLLRLTLAHGARALAASDPQFQWLQVHTHSRLSSIYCTGPRSRPGTYKGGRACPPKASAVTLKLRRWTAAQKPQSPPELRILTCFLHVRGVFAARNIDAWHMHVTRRQRLSALQPLQRAAGGQTCPTKRVISGSSKCSQL